MANNQKVQKKLPKRADSSHPRKDRCKRSWLRGQKRKEARRKAQAEAHARNVANGWTPWEKACEARAASRH